MNSLSIGEIKRKAINFAKSGGNWHFHILTPECKLNSKDQFAFVLEDSNSDTSYVFYSNKPPMDFGAELVKLLVNKDILVEKSEVKSKISAKVQKIKKRAEELTKQGKFWHHHMLFPKCVFNKHKGKWTIMFEDQELKQVVESVTESEPKSDLKELEILYYKQEALR